METEPKRRGWGRGYKSQPPAGSLMITTRCPVTHGAITRLTMASFRRLCVHRRDYGSSMCRRCEGRTLPAELEIIEQQEMRQNINKNKENDMSTFGECEICGEKKEIRSVRNRNACATCEHIWRAANVQPDLVLKVLTDAKGEEYLRQAVGEEMPPQGLFINDGDAGEILEQIRKKYDLINVSYVPDFVDNLNRESELLELLKAEVNLDDGEDVIERVTQLMGNADNANRRALATTNIIQDIRGLLDLDPEESILEAVAKIQRDRQQAFDIMYEVASEVGLGLGDIDDMPRIVADIVADRDKYDLELSDLKDGNTLYLGGYEPACPPEYASLHRVLIAALNQAAHGKGRERHAKDGEPFEQQKICEITRRVGLGYPLGQAINKAEESLGLGIDAGIRENLGAINYLAAAVIVMEEQAAEQPQAETPDTSA